MMARRRRVRKFQRPNPAKQAKQAMKATSATNSQDTQGATSPGPQTRAPLYFWHETEPEAGFLSQWWSGCPFGDPQDPSSPAKRYATAEHYMMHHKALLFGDAATAAAILATDPAPHPRKVKALGRAVSGFDEAVWLRERAGVVRRGTRAKFKSACCDANGGCCVSGGGGEGEEAQKRRTMREALLATGERELVEASPFDRVWGIGFRAEEAERNRGRWGENLLGKALMSIRDELRREQDEQEGGVRRKSEDAPSLLNLSSPSSCHRGTTVVTIFVSSEAKARRQGALS